MNEQQRLQVFIKEAKTKGLSKDEIKSLLLENGWEVQSIAQELYGDWAVVPVPDNYAAKPVANLAAGQRGNEPISVVSNLSTRGFEYSIMFVSLLASAFSVGAILHAFVNNAYETQVAVDDYYQSSSSDGIYSFAATVLLVTLPIFVLLFLRLKRAEIADPDLRSDPSRKRMSHLTQFLAFLFGVGYIVYFIYSLLNGTGDSGETNSVMESFVHMVITLSIAGSIFAYLWNDEHRS